MWIYLVEPGDTVLSIAYRYGISSQSIIEANVLQNSDQLFIGQTLVVPLCEMNYRMIPNDNMWPINGNYDLGNLRMPAPGAPTKLTVQRNTVNSVALFWDHAYDSIKVSGYYVLRNNIPIGSTPNRVFIDKTIKIGQVYNYKVTAYTLDKIFSGYSNNARINITPSPGIIFWSKANQYSGFLKGTDVSFYTPELDWNKIKSDGISYVYVRAGNSVLNKGYNPDFMAEKHTLGIKSAGLPVGFYYIPHWSNLDYDLKKAEVEAEKYADHIFSLMGKAGISGYGDLLPVLDIEPPLGSIDVGLTGKQIIDWARAFCDHFKSYTGRTIMIYTNRSFFNDWNIKPDIITINNLPLWNAEYYQFNNYLKYSDDTPRSFGGWSGWNIWQFTQSAIIGGYKNMDASWCRSLDLLMLPSEPTNLIGKNVSPSTVNLSWNKNTEIDLKGYNVYKDGVLISTTNNNFTTVTGLKTGKTYKFKVQALDIFNDVSKSVSEDVYISK
ncbi:GH25 family lysozyme [Clostridium sp.]|uniref:GH25 family lysozyme n=1 Tax=Clostridium sp. TaxID=1506 RepID=UPI001A4FE0F9|nr:GH25 family lysozyme [Clostridium sp.]MBK5235972.1 LysM peptidoglycan-binding domain-containing protein [Clostridium sp.]